MTASQIIYILAVIAILLPLYMTAETFWLQVTRTRISFDIRSLRLRILHISDIHIRFLRISPKRINRIISAENPDIIVMTGDYIDRAVDIPAFMKWLGKISNREKVYLCFGNHDYGAFMHREDPGSGEDEAVTRAGACAGFGGGRSKASPGEVSFNLAAFDSFKKAVAGTGVNLTDNITLEIKVSTRAGTSTNTGASPGAGASAGTDTDTDTGTSPGSTEVPQPRIFLTGLQDCRIRLNSENGKNGDCKQKYSDYGENNSSGSTNGDGCGKINIAVSHNPDIVESLPSSSFDLLLCGHYHGGQIWAPFNLEFRSLRNDILSRKGITRGLHKVNGINIYISRGLGNVLIPFRFMSRPEAAIIDLTGNASEPAK